MWSLHREVTTQGVGLLVIVSTLAIAATIVGTTVAVSGVALALPVAVIAIATIARAQWKIGQAGILVLALGLGAGVAYQLEAALHPETGSYGDQGAIALAAAGLALCSAAASLLRWLPRGARRLLAIACVLTPVCGIGLVGAMSGSGLLLVGVATATAWTAGWIYVGVHLLRLAAR